MTTALVLAAGKATRLVGLRERWAKACVPVGTTTPLGFLLPRLFEAGVDHAILNLHYKPEQVERLARTVAPEGMHLSFLRESALLGTGGTLAAAADRHELPDLIVNAKVFTDFNFRAVLALPAPAVVVHPPSDLSVFGGFCFREGRLIGLRPAGPPRREPGCAVFTGISRPAEAWLPYLHAALREDPEAPLCLVRDALLPALVDGIPVRVLPHRGTWFEISTPERLEEARE
ncbi:MAG: NDP-sugar synthase, partial [Planctomycetota bacterium]